jgi:hypothetical protein
VKYAKPREKWFSKHYALRQLKNMGYDVIENACPDLIAMRGSKLVLIVVENYKSRRPKRVQMRVLNEFAKHGIPCYQMTVKYGLMRLRAPLPGGSKKEK